MIAMWDTHTHRMSSAAATTGVVFAFRSDCTCGGGFLTTTDSVHQEKTPHQLPLRRIRVCSRLFGTSTNINYNDLIVSPICNHHCVCHKDETVKENRGVWAGVSPHRLTDPGWHCCPLDPGSFWPALARHTAGGRHRLPGTPHLDRVKGHTQQPHGGPGIGSTLTLIIKHIKSI